MISNTKHQARRLREQSNSLCTLILRHQINIEFSTLFRNDILHKTTLLATYASTLFHTITTTTFSPLSVHNYAFKANQSSASHDPAPLATLELHHLHSPSPVELTVLQSSPRPAPALVPPPISVSGPAPQQALPAVSDPSSAAPPAPLTLPDPDSAAAAPPDLEPSSVDPLALPAELPSSTAPLPSSPPLHGHHMITRLRDGVKQPKIRTDGTTTKIFLINKHPKIFLRQTPRLAFEVSCANFSCCVDLIHLLLVVAALLLHDQLCPIWGKARAHLFLSRVHQDTSGADLEFGALGLKTDLKGRTHQRKQLVKDNFDCFVSCKTTIDVILVYIESKLKWIEDDPEGSGTSHLFNLMQGVNSRASCAFEPLFERQVGKI
ncbi:hypothetical protein LWI28_023822 [Acer negundo]|uniref:Exocyst complex component SEC5 n=1 Tax=Acer negundo TaxID=4023 RepID=A0AAD5IGX0_ACENE|nr:hypothetical protein LWI28_023822 [Acer negundo]